MARQYDVLRTADGMLVVVIQSDLLDSMRPRVVAPLLPIGASGQPIRHLNPEITIGDEGVVLMPQLLATLTMPELGRPVRSVAHLRDTITRTIDLLQSGI